MKNDVLRQMMDLYGLNPNILPLPLQFPRIPPGVNHPFKLMRNPMKEKFQKDGNDLSGKLNEFQNMYIKYAKGLLEMTNPGIVPPGHPLFSQNSSIETLKNENAKLQKDNIELKKQLESKSKNKKS